jgi:hypothetical protein
MPMLSRFDIAVLTVFIMFMFRVNVYSQAEGIEYSPYSDSVEISSAGKSIADSAFDYIANRLGFINFDDCNNCDSRAHLIAAILENKFPALNTAKVWLFADFKRASQGKKYRYKKYVYLSSNNECSSWGYHVAPVVLIKTKNTVDTIVLDPSTQSKPVSLRRWALELTPQGEKTYLIMKDRKYYTFPDNPNKKFEDMKKEWVDDDKLLNDDDYSKSIEKILKSKHGIREHWLFSSEIKRIQELLNNDDN